MAQILTLQALRDCLSARSSAVGSGLPASGAGVVASNGLVDWLVSSAKAGKLEMIMMPAKA